MADKYIKNPQEFVHAGQKVKVRVTGIDAKRNRISLSMRGIS
jgi:uncharacterized protein